MLIGRDKEIQELQQAYNSDESKREIRNSQPMTCSWTCEELR